MSDEVETSGPWFDGRASDAVRRYVAWTEQTVAEEGARMVKVNLHSVLRHPTGRYESGIRATPDAGHWTASDGGVVYGPWLEGTGSMNSPRTRFPGYATFRRTSSELDAKAQSLVDPVPEEFMGAMNE